MPPVSNLCIPGNAGSNNLALFWTVRLCGAVRSEIYCVWPEVGAASFLKGRQDDDRAGSGNCAVFGVASD